MPTRGFRGEFVLADAGWMRTEDVRIRGLRALDDQMGHVGVEKEEVSGRLWSGDDR